MADHKEPWVMTQQEYLLRVLENGRRSTASNIDGWKRQLEKLGPRQGVERDKAVGKAPASAPEASAPSPALKRAIETYTRAGGWSGPA